MPTVSTISPQNALDGLIPCEGPKALPYLMDFSAAAEYDFDFTQQWQQQTFSTIQCCYIDNSLNASPVTVTVNGTGQTITCPANSQGFFTLLTVPPPQFAVVSAGSVVVQIIWLNFYIPPTVWSTP